MHRRFFTQTIYISSITSSISGLREQRIDIFFYISSKLQEKKQNHIKTVPELKQYYKFILLRNL